MQLENHIYYKSSEDMNELGDESVDLIVTSPPYPMIEMWDGIFAGLSESAAAALIDGDGNRAWAMMHDILDEVWNESFRVLKPGGFACINIGDACRKIGEDFRLYSNHSRISLKMTELGFDSLPMVHWFKPTNAPNKFMGSGMLPSGAYITLEHEYILIFRKGGKRKFSAAEAELRRESAFFWEERNSWFSDVWDFRGVNQPLKKKNCPILRDRSGAYPFELPHRLINMYSMKADTVLDPFMGTGTTLAAAVLNARSCIGYETDSGLSEVVRKTAEAEVENAPRLISERIQRHRAFIDDYSSRRGSPKYVNEHYGFPVVTAQERLIQFHLPKSFSVVEDDADVQKAYCVRYIIK